MFYKIITLTALLTVLPVSANNTVTAVDIQNIKSQAAVSLKAQLDSELLQLNKEMNTLTIEIDNTPFVVPASRYVNNAETANEDVMGV